MRCLNLEELGFAKEWVTMSGGCATGKLHCGVGRVCLRTLCLG